MEQAGACDDAKVAGSVPVSQCSSAGRCSSGHRQRGPRVLRPLQSARHSIPFMMTVEYPSVTFLAPTASQLEARRSSTPCLGVHRRHFGLWHHTFPGDAFPVGSCDDKGSGETYWLCSCPPLQMPAGRQHTSITFADMYSQSPNVKEHDMQMP